MLLRGCIMGGGADVVSVYVKILLAITLGAVLFLVLNKEGQLIPFETESNLDVLNVQIDFNDKFRVKKKKYFAIIMVPTIPAHVRIREVIRGSWGNISAWSVGMENLESKYKSIKLMWVIGYKPEYPEEFNEEVSKYDDIYICDKIDEQRTALKYKVLWSYMRSVQLFDFKYFVKTDDDILLNMPLLLTYLKNAPRTHFYGGRCVMGYGGFGGYPKWKYCSGGGYYMSKDVVEHAIALPSEHHRVPFRPEDAYTGYLVHMTRTDLNYNVTMERNNRALHLSKYKCGPWNFIFYHNEYGKMQEHFDMLTVNKTIDCV